MIINANTMPQGENYEVRLNGERVPGATYADDVNGVVIGFEVWEYKPNMYVTDKDDNLQTIPFKYQGEVEIIPIPDDGNDPVYQHAEAQAAWEKHWLFKRGLDKEFDTIGEFLLYQTKAFVDELKRNRQP